MAGANGSGKSTIAKELLPAENISYVNADDIARELCPEDMQKVRIQAGKEVHFRIAEFGAEILRFGEYIVWRRAFKDHFLGKTKWI